MSHWSGRLWRFLASRRLAVILLTIEVGIIALGTLFPNPAVLEPEARAAWQQRTPWRYTLSARLNLDAVVGSAAFQALQAALFLSTLLCTANRLRGFQWKRLPASGEVPAGEWVRLEQVFRRRGFRLEPGPAGRGPGLTARKGRPGFAGSVLFHAGMLLVFVAAWISLAFRLGGGVLLTEGFPVALQPSSSVKVERWPRWGPQTLPRLQLQLTEFAPAYVQARYPVDYAGALAVEGEGEKVEAVVRVNQPLSAGGLSFTLERYGFAPAFRVEDAAGRELIASYYNLVVMGEDQEDQIAVPGGPVFRVQFYPDFVEEGSRPASRSREPHRPVAALRPLETPLQPPVLIGRGETGQVGEYQVTFLDLRYWAYLGFNRDPGATPLALGFGLIVAGLLIRLWFYDREVRVEKAGAGWLVSGSSRYFPVLFEKELEALRKEIGAL